WLLLPPVPSVSSSRTSRSPGTAGTTAVRAHSTLSMKKVWSACLSKETRHDSHPHHELRPSILGKLPQLLQQRIPGRRLVRLHRGGRRWPRGRPPRPAPSQPLLRGDLVSGPGEPPRGSRDGPPGGCGVGRGLRGGRRRTLGRTVRLGPLGLLR